MNMDKTARVVTEDSLYEKCKQMNSKGGIRKNGSEWNGTEYFATI
jgi:hypothetical protein